MSRSTRKIRESDGLSNHATIGPQIASQAEPSEKKERVKEADSVSTFVVPFKTRRCERVLINVRVCTNCLYDLSEATAL